VRALTWQGDDRIETLDVPRPEPKPGWAIVETAYTGLCGTDLHICNGQHPRARPGIILGHEVAGRLSEPARGWPTGTPVMVNPLLSCGDCTSCRYGRGHVCERLGLLGIDAPGGAAEYLAAPEQQLVRLPEALDLRNAALIEPLAVAVRAVRRGRLRLGDRVHVIGAGPVGLLIANCARLSGAATLTVSEPAPHRAAAATSYGFELREKPEREADVVFDCTGHPAVSPTVLEWAANSGTVVTVGTYPGITGVDLQSVVLRELAITGTRVYAPEDVAAAAESAARDPFGLHRLVTSVMPLDKAPDAIPLLLSGKELKVLIAGPGAR
jgi:(R,R)-butanediol dehydrogenase / meso-butanediol dehydrogenase / diacetyl reductase